MGLARMLLLLFVLLSLGPQIARPDGARGQLGEDPGAHVACMAEQQ